MKFLIALFGLIAISQCVFLPQMKNGNIFAEIQQVKIYIFFLFILINLF